MPTCSSTAQIAWASNPVPSCVAVSKVLNSLSWATASSRDARSRRGSDANLSVAEAVRAGLIIQVAISSANRSSASSIATASRCRVIASRVAVRRGSVNSCSVTALLANPYRARAVIRLAGTAEQSTARTRRPSRSAARSKALTRPGPDTRVGARRQDSSSENREPSGTVSDARSRRGSIGSTAVAAAARLVCIRCAAASRTVRTNRVSTVIPGSSTRWRRNHPTPWSNNAPGPSAWVHSLPSKNCRSCAVAATSSKTRNP